MKESEVQQSQYCSAINAASRYYVIAATLLSERTTHIALFSLFQTVGFILGPGLMAVLGYLGTKGFTEEGKFVFDMNTSTA